MRRYGRNSALDVGQRLKPYALALVCIAVSTLVALLIEPFSSLEDEAMIYLLAVIFAALRFDTKASITAAIGSVLACDFLFVQPRMTFAWTDMRKTLTFLAMIVVAVVVSGLSRRLRHQEQVARRAAAATKTLYELNVELANSGDPLQLVATTRRRLERLFDAEIMILLGASAAPDNMAGHFWLPVPGSQEPLGLIGIELGAGFEAKSEPGLLLSACARELGAAIERTQLTNAAQRSKLDAETERMRSSLLSAVSHDLKTPLAGIVASGTTLLGHGGDLDARDSSGLVAAMVRDCERVAHLLQNLLSMSRLESPNIELRKTPEALEDIVAAALGRVNDSLALRQVRISLPPDLPWVMVEPGLIELVLLNLLENALRYTPSAASIEVAAEASDAVVKLRVSDDGPGISERERERVFEEFFRGSRASKTDGGVGLGLPICRAIVRAHGGKIAVRERQGGGALVEFTLPVTPEAAAWSESLRKVSA